MHTAPGSDFSLARADISLDAFEFVPAPLVVRADTHGAFVVPDPDLLFHGEYRKLGGDLMLTGDDGHSALIVDYFRSAHRHDLLSPDGARISGDVVELLAGPDNPGRYAQATAPSPAALSIGRVVSVTGNATVIRNGVIVTLNMGDSIYRSDVIQTGSNSTLGIVLIDTTTFSLNANARMAVTDLAYDAGSTSNSAVFGLVQGTISFVAGQVAKTGDMRIETPSANLGIRGTAVLAEINATDGTTKVSVLVEPNGVVGSFNLYDKATGVLIGTVSQAGQVTIVTPVGIGQLAQVVTEPKALADIAFEQAIARQLFQTYSLGVSTPQNDPGGSGTKGSSTALADITKPNGQTETLKITLTSDQLTLVPNTGDVKYEIPKATVVTVVLTFRDTHPFPIIFSDPGDTAVGHLARTGDPFGRGPPFSTTLTLTGTETAVSPDLLDVVSVGVSRVSHTGNTGGLTDQELLGFFSVTPGPVSDGVDLRNKFEWFFAADPGTFDYLGVNDVLTLQYTIHPTDLNPETTSGDGVVTINILGHAHPYLTVVPPAPGTPAQDVDSSGQKFLSTGPAELFTRAGTVVENDPAPDVISVRVLGVSHVGPTSGKTDADFLSYFSVTAGPVLTIINAGGSAQYHWTFN